MEIGMIGYGRYGEFIAGHLSKEFKVYIYNRSDKREKIERKNAIPCSFSEACKKDALIIAVPISAFEETIKKAKHEVSKDTLIIETCSVKEFPIKIMEKYLSKDTQILSAHTLFGPDSAKYSLKGHKIVLFKIRVAEEIYKKAVQGLEKKGLVVIGLSAAKHDEYMANAMVLPHFIGRALIDMGMSENVVATANYQRLLEIYSNVKNDTWQLFIDMKKYNRFAKEVMGKFMKSVEKISKKADV
jgi:prephenate dehydrogenase